MYQLNDITVRVPAGQCAGRVGIFAENISVEWDPCETALAPDAAAHLESRWQCHLADAKAHGKTLFNGRITRLIHARQVRSVGSAGAWHAEDRLVLRLGPADYKTFLVTRLRDRTWFERNAPAAQVLALGNSALLTAGDEALLGIRSARVSAYAGRAHLLGGVLELLGTPRFTANTNGIVAHLRAELQEEAGVTDNDLQPPGRWPRFLGIAEDQALAQPEAIWQWEVRTPLADIGRRLDPAEHEGWLLVHRGRMTDELWQRMTPVARYTWRTWSGDSLNRSADQ
jgi:hypothetical protein